MDKLLSNKEDFNNKALWKKASKDARKCILKNYIDNKTLEEEIIKAAQDLNISMVSMALKDTDEKIKVMDNKNYILLTYLARDLAKCPVVWIEELREICVVKGEYLGNGLVKGKKCKDGYELINVYGENLCTVRRDPWQNTIIPVYTKGKDNYYIMGGIGQMPALIQLDKDALIMPKSSWKRVDLS